MSDNGLAVKENRNKTKDEIEIKQTHQRKPIA